VVLTVGHVLTLCCLHLCGCVGVSFALLLCEVAAGWEASMCAVCISTAVSAWLFCFVVAGISACYGATAIF